MVVSLMFLTSQMLHAGICTPTFTPFLWPSFVGKYSTMVRIWAYFSHPVLLQVEVTGNSTNATTVKAATETDEGDEGKVGGVPIRGAPIGNHRKP